MTAHPSEIEFRRRWYHAHVKRFEADRGAFERAEARLRGFAASATEALALRDALARTGDVEAFKSGMQAWATKPQTLAFNGNTGQGFVNLLVKRSVESERLARLLTECLAVPRDDAEAFARIRALVDYVEEIKVGAHPAPGNCNFLLSYFWALADHGRWPVIWPSAVAFLECSTGEPLPGEPSERYRHFLSLVRELDDDFGHFEQTVAWWEEQAALLLDPVLSDRCAFNFDGAAVDEGLRTVNAAALLSIGRRIGANLADAVSDAVGRKLTVKRPEKTWAPGYPRADLWVDWVVDKGWGLGIRLWINHNGAAIGLVPGMVRQGWLDEVTPVLSGAAVAGFRVLAARGARIGDDVGFVAGRSGEFTYARWFERDELSELDLRQEVISASAALQPLLDQLVTLAGGEEPPSPDDPLLPLVSEFREQRGYPTPADEQHKADREVFAQMLEPDAIASCEPAELRRIWNTTRYGGPGPQAALNVSFRDADPGEYNRILESILHLCWGEGDDAGRIDAILEDEHLRVKGLGEAVIMKLLAICKPERYLPVHPYSGPHGKQRMLQALELAEPADGTRGEMQVGANDHLRERLEAFFPGDPWGMAQFLYWYSERDPVPPPVDPLDDLAEELLVDRAFLDEVVELLDDKGQIILYGPPGTGKTYLARKLAEALVPDPTRRSLVQFHPSTSYEDFFEGYRPETGPDGEMTYRLTPGPLARLAVSAMNAPGKRHVMIIDEINRANLPRVLGELLFLFEYRGEQVRTLYRPDDGFELPKDLWFIGTMNTADRSIALVDAALRRRFHFVPFFPDHGPMEGLLGRWLATNGEPAWVGDLVAMVNDEIEDELGGPHLQLGPSHFMRPKLDERSLARIWRYNIEPFIEDQFFGDPARIDKFRFEAVLKRFRDLVSEGEPADTAGAPGEESESVPAEAGDE